MAKPGLNTKAVGRLLAQVLVDEGEPSPAQNPFWAYASRGVEIDHKFLARWRQVLLQTDCDTKTMAQFAESWAQKSPLYQGAIDRIAYLSKLEDPGIDPKVMSSLGKLCRIASKWIGFVESLQETDSFLSLRDKLSEVVRTTHKRNRDKKDIAQARFLVSQYQPVSVTTTKIP